MYGQILLIKNHLYSEKSRFILFSSFILYPWQSIIIPSQFLREIAPNSSPIKKEIQPGKIIWRSNWIWLLLNLHNIHVPCILRKYLTPTCWKYNNSTFSYFGPHIWNSLPQDTAQPYRLLKPDRKLSSSHSTFAPNNK